MSGRQANSPAPQADAPSDIRNVVLVGPAGSGKSRLFGHIIAADRDAGPALRSVETDDQPTPSLNAATIEVDGVVLNLIDAPGYPDFVGALRAGLRAADAAIFVVSATDGVDGTTANLWHECQKVGLPRAVAITKLDAPRADFSETLGQIRQAFGESAMPLGVPQVIDGSVASIVDLVLGEVHDYGSGERVVRPTDDSHIETFAAYQGQLIEGIIQESEDETLMERYLGGEEVGFDVLEPALLTAVSRGTFHPVVPVSTDTGAGIDVLLHLVHNGFPPPGLHAIPAVTDVDGQRIIEVTADPEGPLVAEVVQTTADPYVGQVALVRIFSGTLRPDSAVHVSGHMERLLGHELEGHRDHDEEVRVGALAAPFGAELRAKPHAIAGDLVVIGKLPTAQTSDTLSDCDNPLLIAPWELPEPLLPTAITPASRTDEGKLPEALRRLGATDPSLRVEHNPDTAQTVLWTMGQLHLDQVLGDLSEKFHVAVEPVELKIALRETISSSASGQGRHVKQSGGHGQYAVCRIEVEPLERGGGFEFVDKVVGGAVPRQFIPSVEKGVRAQLARGVVSGFPMVDVRVTLVDGKAHSVDSSDAAFQAAGALAVREACAEAATTVLEPIDGLVITIGDDYVGAVMSDLTARRARINGTDSAEQVGHTVVVAEVPQSELTRYALDLRSLSHGSGSFTRSLAGYEVMPPNIATKHLS